MKDNLVMFSSFVMFLAVIFGLSASAADNNSGNFGPRGNFNGGENGKPQMNGEMKAPMGGGMSEEALEVCEDKSEGDDCEFEMKKPNSDDEGTVSGTCQTMKGGKDSEEKLVCMKKKEDYVDDVNRVKVIKEKKETEIKKIKKRVEKIIDFLDDKGVDDDLIEEISDNFETFKSDADNLLSKFDDYIDLLESDDSDEDSKVEAWKNIKNSGKELVEYFNENIRKNIKEAIDSLED